MMFTSSQLFQDIVRPCNNCGISFDVRLHSPHILSCSHTFCLMCLTKTEQRKKRHCFQCKTKYSKFAPNVALMEVIQRLEDRGKYIDSEIRKCDECSNCVPAKLLRRCVSCETHFSSRTDVSLDCVICLECCVNSHNGHKLTHDVTCRSPSSIRHPIEEKEQTQVKFRERTESSSSILSYNKKRVSSRGFMDNFKRLSFNRSTNDVPYFLNQTPRLSYHEDDVVMSCKTPFYDNNHQMAPVMPTRYICNDTISVDSVFEGSPQSTIMHQTPPYNKNHSPISLRFFCPPNDSGIHSNTPPARFSHSSISLHPNSFSSSTPKHSHFGTIRPRVRMGVSDLINNRKSAVFSSPIEIPNLKSTRSESSVCHFAENPQYSMFI
ncbi:unnamed protein product [Caenorhabditis angaria]|uniref:RING-type domain-containing protein n=1 Tax=Caenorhabditis angaria TaxID=860376 RepID=A0A9P1MYZ5_9PELO|nr:unnamed protein product [Caenorhabditis angaria]